MQEAKYADIDDRNVFELIAVETLGIFNSSALILPNDLGRRNGRISEISGELSVSTSVIDATVLQCCSVA